MPFSFLLFRGPRKVADFLGRGETYEAVISKSYCILLRLRNVFGRDEARSSQTKVCGDTHAGTTTVHRTVAIRQAELPCSSLVLFYTNKKRTADAVLFFVGADDEARTRYLNLGKVALYRVSYIRKCKSNYTYYTGFCQGFFKNKNVYKL